MTTCLVLLLGTAIRNQSRTQKQIAGNDLYYLFIYLFRCLQRPFSLKGAAALEWLHCIPAAAALSEGVEPGVVIIAVT